MYYQVDSRSLIISLYSHFAWNLLFVGYGGRDYSVTITMNGPLLEHRAHTIGASYNQADRNMKLNNFDVGSACVESQNTDIWSNWEMFWFDKHKFTYVVP